VGSKSTQDHPISAHLFGNVFRQNSHKIVILSGARHSFMCDRALDGAESKDPEGAYLPMRLGAFRPPRPENRILLRYALDGRGYIFSCLSSPALGKIFALERIVRMRVELLVRGPNQGKTVAGPQVWASVVEKLRAAWAR
jgi:hypothetical protein